jgi:CRP-like cAMP-binding protein
MMTHSEDAFSVLISQIGSEHASVLRTLATIKEYSAGTAILKEGGPVDSLWVILDGILAVSIRGNDGRSLRLGRHGKGKWFGDLSLLTGETTATVTVIAETPVTLFDLKHDLFNRLLVERPDLAGSIVRILIPALVERIRASNAAIALGTGGNLALQGSDTVFSHEAGRRKNQLESILPKLVGLESE